MDGLSGIGANAFPHLSPTETSVERSAPAFAVPDQPKRSATRVEGVAEPAVRPSLLVALQELRMNRPSKAEAGQEGAAPPKAGIFAIAEEDTGRAVIDEIMERGLAEWAHEQWLERIREKARRTALARLGLTEDGVATMNPEMQAQIERLIQEAVDEAVRRAVEKVAGGDEAETTNQAMVLSPIVTGG